MSAVQCRHRESVIDVSWALNPVSGTNSYSSFSQVQSTVLPLILVGLRSYPTSSTATYGTLQHEAGAAACKVGGGPRVSAQCGVLFLGP